MKRKLQYLILVLCTGPWLFQAGCLNPTDFRAIAEGQFISFINALINSVTSDLIRGAIGA